MGQEEMKGSQLGSHGHNSGVRWWWPELGRQREVKGVERELGLPGLPRDHSSRGLQAPLAKNYDDCQDLGNFLGVEL